MMSEEKLKEYFLKEEIFNGFSDFSGYRVLGTFQFSPKYGTLISSGIKIFKTESIAWVEEFRIGIIQNTGDYLVIVSPECPEVYFTMPEEIIDKIKDIYSAGDCIKLDSEVLQKLMEELNDANRKWTTNPITTDPGRMWYYDGTSTNPFVPYSQISTTTCSSDYVVSSASSQIPTNINSNNTNTNTYVTGYNI